MKPDISEFSYGYAVTEELIQSGGARVIAAPVFPSLYEEGKKGGGYDVEIPLKGTPVFLQFKLSDHLKRATAKEHQAGIVGIPYYRMHLRPLKHSDQHNLLLDLAKKGEAVFYIAPTFHLPNELNMCYLDRSVLKNSVAFDPLDIGPLPDDDDHYVVFEKGTATAYRCSSEPVQIVRTSLEGGVRRALLARSVQARDLGETGLLELSRRMLDSIEEVGTGRSEPRLRESAQSYENYVAIPSIERAEQEIETVRQIVDSRRPVESAAYLARTFFGCELIVVE